MWSANVLRVIAAVIWLLSTAAFPQTVAEWDSAHVNAIAAKLRCPCGCNLQMSCQMPPHPCPTCKENRIRIYNMLAKGMSEQQILDEYVREDAGSLWVTPGSAGRAAPYAVLAAGFGGVLFVIRRYLQRGPAAPDVVDGAMLERVAKETAEFE